MGPFEYGTFIAFLISSTQLKYVLAQFLKDAMSDSKFLFIQLFNLSIAQNKYASSINCNKSTFSINILLKSSE